MPIKQGNFSVIYPGLGALSTTEYMKLSTKEATINIPIRRIRLNEPDKKLDELYVSLVKNILRLKKKRINAIHVVRGPIQQGTYYILVDGHHRLEAYKRARYINVDAVELPHLDVRYDFGPVPD